jgi:hypothetical protein
VEDEIRTQRSRGLREWKQIVELLLSESLCQFCLSTQPAKVATWLSTRVKQELWLSAASSSTASLSVIPSTLSDAEVQYLFEIEAPHDMAASIELLIPFFEASTVMKRMVHPAAYDVTSEENISRMRDAFDRLIESLDSTKVSELLARSIACVVISKDGLDLLVRIMRTNSGVENGLKSRISTIIQLLLSFHFEYSTEPTEREVRMRVIHFAELRAAGKASKITAPTSSERVTITQWVKLIVADPKQNYRAKAAERLLRWSEANEGVSDAEADAMGNSSDPLKRRRPSLLLTEGVLEVLFERIRLNSHYSRHEPHPLIRATLVRLISSILKKGGEAGRSIFRKLEVEKEKKN